VHLTLESHSLLLQLIALGLDLFEAAPAFLELPAGILLRR
jgi:hypothetical protein